MLTSQGAVEERDLDSPLLIGLLSPLLEVLVSLEGLLRIGYILLNIAKTLIASTYHILGGLKSTICIKLLLIIAIFVLQEIELFYL